MTAGRDQRRRGALPRGLSGSRPGRQRREVHHDGARGQGARAPRDRRRVRQSASPSTGPSTRCAPSCAVRLETVAASARAPRDRQRADGAPARSARFPAARESMVESEIEQLMSDAAVRPRRAGASRSDEYLKQNGKTEDELRRIFRQEAERRVKGTLLIEAIAKREQIAATPADIADELEVACPAIRAARRREFARPWQQRRLADGRHRAHEDARSPDRARRRVDRPREDSCVAPAS